MQHNLYGAAGEQYSPGGYRQLGNVTFVTDERNRKIWYYCMLIILLFVTTFCPDPINSRLHYRFSSPLPQTVHDLA